MNNNFDVNHADLMANSLGTSINFFLLQTL